MKEKPKFVKEKILHYSSKNGPISNYSAIHRIAFDLGISPEHVKRIIEAFFGMYGIKFFIRKRIEMNIKGLGKFYFHKKVFNAYHKKRLSERGDEHRKFMNKFNAKLK